MADKIKEGLEKLGMIPDEKTERMLPFAGGMSPAGITMKAGGAIPFVKNTLERFKGGFKASETPWPVMSEAADIAKRIGLQGAATRVADKSREVVDWFSKSPSMGQRIARAGAVAAPLGLAASQAPKILSGSAGLTKSATATIPPQPIVPPVIQPESPTPEAPARNTGGMTQIASNFTPTNMDEYAKNNNLVPTSPTATPKAEPFYNKEQAQARTDMVTDAMAALAREADRTYTIKGINPDAFKGGVGSGNLPLPTTTFKNGMTRGMARDMAAIAAGIDNPLLTADTAAAGHAAGLEGDRIKAAAVKESSQLSSAEKMAELQQRMKQFGLEFGLANEKLGMEGANTKDKRGFENRKLWTETSLKVAELLGKPPGSTEVIEATKVQLGLK